MEYIGLINVHINGVVALQSLLSDVILNGGYIVVDEQLFAVLVTGKPAHLVVKGDNVRVKAADKIIQRFQRSYLAAGGNVNVHSECCYSVIGMKLRICVHRQMALVQMSRNAVLVRTAHALIAGLVFLCADAVLLGNKQGRRCSLRLIILL